MKKKVIITLIITIILLSFLMPKNVHASKNDGGKLVEPIAQFLCYVPDAVFNVLQKMLVSSEGIETKVSGDSIYKMLYSPAKIFSGGVPAFDINFIGGSESKTEADMGTAIKLSKAKEVEYKFYSKGDNDELEIKVNELKSNYDFDASRNLDADAFTESITHNFHNPSGKIKEGYVNSTFRVAWTNLDKSQVYLIYCVEYYQINSGQNEVEIPTAEVILYKIELNNYNSTASVLQNTIATWYNIFRRIALVGLLSVLVYIGIQIVLTSASAKDKAKYKNMLKDWFIALCILFTLHYIMSITVTIVENINEVLKTSTIGEGGEDVLLTTLRNNIARGDNWGDVIVQVVIYCVLAVYTVIFTIQYFRRTIYIAFLTMVAPLITLTYPLDKIKDKKSQAFDMWIKDYIFFILLQVVHLLIYYILVGSSFDLASEGNWIFAIVAIGFLVPAEKIIKKMFGFEKSSSMGALAAGATGALVVNALQKLPKGSSKGGGKSGGNSGEKEKSSNNNIRTVSNDPLASLRAGVGANGNGVNGGLGTNRSSTGENIANSPASGTSVNTSKGNAWNGAGAVARKYVPRTIKGVMKGTAKGFVGATGAMIGFASGVAQGDVSAALKGAAAGGAAGTGLARAGINMAKNIPGGIKNTINDLEDTWNQGAHGSNIAQNKK